MSDKIQRRALFAMSGGALLFTRLTWAEGEVPGLLDHILLGCNDLERGIAFVEEKTGVRAVFGGVHPGRGTQNALLALGERRYLEIIAPDPKQSGVEWFREIKDLATPRIIGWAEHTQDIEELAKKFRAAGIQAEEPRPGSRKRPDGRILSWKTMNLADNRIGLLPFFIEWSKDSLHPSVDSPGGCRLGSFQLVCGDYGEWRKLIRALGLDLPVEHGEKTQLVAKIVGPKGSLDALS
jgi:hypothetical protein